MPWFSEVSYSREATVAAVNDYFDFLASMYIAKSAVLRPPEGGWPEMAANGFREALGKTDEVVLLLRNLPYLARLSQLSVIDAGPTCTGFCSWLGATDSQEGMELALMITEGSLFHEDGLIPPHVIGLAHSQNDHFMLDTELGVIYWSDCPDGIRYNPSREPILDFPYDSEYTPEEEEEWRAAGPAWAIVDFFELLKDQFRVLFFVPFSSRATYTDEHLNAEEAAGVLAVQAIYREHGWPDLERFRKQECLRAVEAALQEKFPAMACGHDEYDYE